MKRILAILPLLAASVSAAEPKAAAEAATAVAAGLSGNLPVALVGLGAALGVGMVASKASEAIGRNPGAFGKIFLLALLGMAFAEGLAILVYFVVPR
jgi:F-type H+-transporting ATPase subunit c